MTDGCLINCLLKLIAFLFPSRSTVIARTLEVIVTLLCIFPYACAANAGLPVLQVEEKSGQFLGSALVSKGGSFVVSIACEGDSQLLHLN